MSTSGKEQLEGMCKSAAAEADRQPLCSCLLRKGPVTFALEWEGTPSSDFSLF